MMALWVYVYIHVRIICIYTSHIELVIIAYSLVKAFGSSGYEVRLGLVLAWSGGLSKWASNGRLGDLVHGLYMWTY